MIATRETLTLKLQRWVVYPEIEELVYLVWVRLSKWATTCVGVDENIHLTSPRRYLRSRDRNLAGQFYWPINYVQTLTLYGASLLGS